MTVHTMKRKPGPKKGQLHSGMFQAGPDSRRYIHDGARRATRLELEDLCKAMTPLAMETLEGLLTSPNEKVRLEALAQVLDRGWGRSVDRVQIQQVGNNHGDVKDMDTEAIIAAMQHSLDRQPVANFIEHDDD